MIKIRNDNETIIFFWCLILSSVFVQLVSYHFVTTRGQSCLKSKLAVVYLILPSIELCQQCTDKQDQQTGLSKIWLDMAVRICFMSSLTNLKYQVEFVLLSRGKAQEVTWGASVVWCLSPGLTGERTGHGSWEMARWHSTMFFSRVLHLGETSTMTTCLHGYFLPQPTTLNRMRLKCVTAAPRLWYTKTFFGL